MIYIYVKKYPLDKGKIYFLVEQGWVEEVQDFLPIPSGTTICYFFLFISIKAFQKCTFTTFN